MSAGGLNSSAKPKLPTPSPSAATLSGYSAPQTPGPEIGSTRTRSGVSFTAPDLRHATSASARHGSRSAWKNPRPQPASDTRTKEPTRYKRTPRAIRARSTNLFKDSSTTLPEHRPCGEVGIVSDADFFRRERIANFRFNAGSDVNQGSLSNGLRRSFRQQTERCHRLYRIRLRRRHRARRVLGAAHPPTGPQDLSPGGRPAGRFHERGFGDVRRAEISRSVLPLIREAR